MSDPSRLFRVRTTDIFEHPPDLPTDAAAIAEGPIEGWEAYAPNFDGDLAKVIGPFDPEIRRENVCWDGERQTVLSIAVPDQYGRDRCTHFYYHPDREGQSYGPDVPHWYQSGHTLRFVRKRKDTR